MTKVYQQIASLVTARANCLKSGNEWAGKHEDTIKAIVNDYLPSGSGFDSGTQIDLDKSTGDKLVFYTSYHHMDENGMYDGWTEHHITVRASLHLGLRITISGPNRNDAKEHLYQTINGALTQEFDPQEFFAEEDR